MIEYLADVGFKFVSLNQSIVAGDSMNLAITFDDGYAHLIHTLPPLIDKYRLKPTIFVPTAFIGMNNNWDYSSIIKAEPHLDKTQIAELASLGVEFGSHGHRHIDLTRCATETLHEELRHSKSILEDITGRAIESLSYPFGRFNSDIVPAAQNAGYNRALTMRFPNEQDSEFTLGRVPVYFFDIPAFVNQKLNSGRMRNVHQGLNRFINVLSRGTTILSQLSGRFKN